MSRAVTSVRFQMEEALIRWAEALSGATLARDKQAFLKRFVGFFAEEGEGPIEAQTWERAFQLAVRSAEEAKSALKQVPASFMRKPQWSGVLLQLLDLSGDTKRYIEVGKKALLHHPRLALPLGEKLLQLGRKGEAIKVAEKALKNAEEDYSFYEGPSLQAQLLRFLIRICDPHQDYARRVLYEELGVLCPIQGEESRQVRGYSGESHRAIACLIWAILTRQGGPMEAAAITEAIAQHRGCKPQSAAAQRSIGLKVLQQLGYVEIEREGNRLGMVRLTQGSP